MDALIAAVTQYQDWGKVNVTQMFGPRFNRVNIFYSTPEYYTEMKHNETQKWHKQAAAVPMTELKDTNHTPSWSVKSDDFFPYSDCNNCYWTGYFTSRTTLKRLERVSSSFLLAARQIETIPNATGPHTECCLDSSDESKIDGCPCGQRPLYELEDALGVAQHHDAVSGTSKQHVAFDYAKRLDRGIRRAEKMLVRTLKRVVLQPSDAVTYLEDLTYCQLLNETICEVSQVSCHELSHLYVDSMSLTHTNVSSSECDASQGRKGCVRDCLQLVGHAAIVGDNASCIDQCRL